MNDDLGAVSRDVIRQAGQRRQELYRCPCGWTLTTWRQGNKPAQGARSHARACPAADPRQLQLPGTPAAA